MCQVYSTVLYRHESVGVVSLFALLLLSFIVFSSIMRIHIRIMLMLIRILKLRSCWCWSTSLNPDHVDAVPDPQNGSCWRWSTSSTLEHVDADPFILKSESCWCWFLSSNPNHVDADSYPQIRITLMLILILKSGLRCCWSVSNFDVIWIILYKTENW